MTPLVPIVCNQIVTVILGLIGAKLISEFVPHATYGYYANFLTLTQLGLMVTHSGLINHAMRYWQREKPQARDYTRFLWMKSWQALATLGPLLLLISMSVAWFEGEAAWVGVFPWLALGNMAVVLAAIATGVLNADRRLWGVLAVSSVGTAARTLVPIGLALGLGMTFFNLSAGFALHGLVLFGCLAVMFRATLHPARESHNGAGSGEAPGEPRNHLVQESQGSTGSSHHQKSFEASRIPHERNPLQPMPERAPQWRQELKDYGRPFVLLGIGAWLLQCVDRWVVWLFFGEAQAGLFAYAFAIGAIIPTFMVGGVMQRVFPEVFQRADQARTIQEWRQIAKLCDQVTAFFLVLTGAGLAVLHAVGPYLLGWLISDEYAPSVKILVPAGFAMVTSQINQFYYLLLQGQHNSAGMVKVMTVVAGVKTLGSLIAAAISWPVFLGWLMASTVVSGLIGRLMIRRMALDGTRSPRLAVR